MAKHGLGWEVQLIPKARGPPAFNCRAVLCNLTRGAHLLGDADAPAYCAMTSAAPGDVWNGDCGAEPAAGVCLSPDMNRNILLPGATGDLKASLLRAGLSVVDGTGDLDH